MRARIPKAAESHRLRATEFNSAGGESGSRNETEIKTGPGVNKRYQIFSGGNNKAYIVLFTNCNTVIQDKGMKPVMKGWSRKIEGKNLG